MDEEDRRRLSRRSSSIRGRGRVFRRGTRRIRIRIRIRIRLLRLLLVLLLRRRRGI